DPGRRLRARLVRPLLPRTPQRRDDLARLRQRIAHLDAERPVHSPVADTEAEQQAPAGELLDRRGLLRQQRRGAEEGVGDAWADGAGGGPPARREGPGDPIHPPSLDPRAPPGEAVLAAARPAR